MGVLAAAVLAAAVLDTASLRPCVAVAVLGFAAESDHSEEHSCDPLPAHMIDLRDDEYPLSAVDAAHDVHAAAAAVGSLAAVPFDSLLTFFGNVLIVNCSYSSLLFVKCWLSESLQQIRKSYSLV